MQIFILGFMGSGKSTVGKLLAPILNRSFYDLDLLIQQNTQSTINEIFSHHGEAYFRQLEKQVLENTQSLEKAVIALGGGTPCFFDNMEWINKHGVSIYLDAAPGLLFQRLISARESRPLVRQLNETELLQYIKNKLEERRHFYEKASVIYKVQQQTPLEIAHHIATHFQQITGH